MKQSFTKYQEFPLPNLLGISLCLPRWYTQTYLDFQWESLSTNMSQVENNSGRCMSSTPGLSDGSCCVVLATPLVILGESWLRSTTSSERNFTICAGTGKDSNGKLDIVCQVQWSTSLEVTGLGG